MHITFDADLWEAVSMRCSILSFVLMTMFLSGCSYLSGIGEFFDKDHNKEDVKEFAA